jgi:chemotaxis signal transduction protein
MAEGGIRELVAFRIDAEEFAVDIASVHEINRITEITRIPNAPSHVQGVINLRGKIVPVVNLRKMLGFERKDADAQSRMIVVRKSFVCQERPLTSRRRFHPGWNQAILTGLVKWMTDFSSCSTFTRCLSRRKAARALLSIE